MTKTIQIQLACYYSHFSQAEADAFQNAWVERMRISDPSAVRYIEANPHGDMAMRMGHVCAADVAEQFPAVTQSDQPSVPQFTSVQAGAMTGGGGTD